MYFVKQTELNSKTSERRMCSCFLSGNIQNHLLQNIVLETSYWFIMVLNNPLEAVFILNWKSCAFIV